MASLSEQDLAALRESWQRQSAAVRDFLWALSGRKNAPGLRTPLHAAFLKLAALPKPPEDERATLFRFAREAAGRSAGQVSAEELFALKFGHGLSYQQIAAIVHIAPKQVGIQFHEALKQRRQSQAPEPAAAASSAQFLP